MKAFPIVLVVIAALLPQSALAARHKPGPVYLRGIAHSVTSTGFSLATTHRGTYAVTTLPATSITVKGKRTTLRNGDHVGVHGFVRGRTIRAIYVHIYPIKPKPFSIKGTVTSISGDTVRIRSGGKIYTARITQQTIIKLGLQPVGMVAIHAGSAVDVRILPGSPATILEIRIRRPPQIHLRLKGTVRFFDGSTLTLSATGITYHIRIDGRTVIYLGNKHAGLDVLAPGRTVTVYACCQGQPLVATSVHVRRIVVVRHTTLLHGRIIAAGPTSVTLAVPGGNLIIAVTNTTIFHVGLTAVTATNLRPGDQVSVRAYRANGRWVATSIHVYAASRAPKTVEGTVVSTGRSSLVVLDRGRRYTVSVPPGTVVTLNGRRVALTALRRGDRIKTVARPGAFGLVAGSIAARRVPPPQATIRGTLVSHSGWILVVARAGKRVTIRPERGVGVRMGHALAPQIALFTGVPVRARGVLTHSVLVASRVSVETSPRDVTGRVTAIGAGTLQVKEQTGHTVLVRMARDGTSIGTEVQIHGFTLGAAVHGVSLRILHPTLDLTGTASVKGQTITLIRTNGDRYTLRIGHGVPITTVRATMTLTTGEIPSGVHLHALGRLQTDGTLLVRSVTVHLASVDLRATVSSLAEGQLTAGGETVTVVGQTKFLQGSKVVTFDDLVVGDDITIYGYTARGGILAREILLHRKLMAVDGTISAIAGDGFTMTVPDGSALRVIVGSATDTGGITPAVALSIHVTGYLRGDGVLLATRLRPGPKHPGT